MPYVDSTLQARRASKPAGGRVQQARLRELDHRQVILHPTKTIVEMTRKLRKV